MALPDLAARQPASRPLPSPAQALRGNAVRSGPTSPNVEAAGVAVNSILHEVQIIPVQIPDTELPPAIERLIDVLRELDPWMLACLAGKGHLRCFELLRFE